MKWFEYSDEAAYFTAKRIAKSSLERKEKHWDGLQFCILIQP